MVLFRLPYIYVYGANGENVYMTRGPRIHLSVSEDIYNDIETRRKTKAGFNASRFFETKYREEFLNEAGLREKIEFHTEELNRHKDRLLGIKTEDPVTPAYDAKRCPICTMFFREDISIRKKTHIYGSLYTCHLCYGEQKEKIDEMVKEMKARDQEVKNVIEN